jgi:hypothetical protein
LANKFFMSMDCEADAVGVADLNTEGGQAQFASYGRDIRDLNDAFEQLWVTRNIDWFTAVEDHSTGKILATGRGKAAEEIFSEFQIARTVVVDADVAEVGDIIAVGGSSLYLKNCVSQRGNPECAYQVNCDYVLEVDQCLEPDEGKAIDSLAVKGCMSICMSEECRIRGTVISWNTPIETQNNALVYPQNNWTITEATHAPYYN